jgi:hypothetical protein
MGRSVKPGEKPDTAELETRWLRYPTRMVNETLIRVGHAKCVNYADKLTTRSLLVQFGE